MTAPPTKAIPDLASVHELLDEAREENIQLRKRILDMAVGAHPCFWHELRLQH